MVLSKADLTFEEASLQIKNRNLFATETLLQDPVLLQLYGSHKQVTVGDIKHAFPSDDSSSEILALKWRSWNAYKGLSREEAMKIFFRIAAVYIDSAPPTSEENSTIVTSSSTIDDEAQPDRASKSSSLSSSRTSYKTASLSLNNLNSAVEKYISNCRKFDIKVDPNVVVALQTRWNLLQPTKMFGDGALLPLLDILDQNDHIQRANLQHISMRDFRFRTSGNGNSNARMLSLVLARNRCIIDLNLAGTGIDDDGLVEISEGLRENNTLTSLNLSSNNFGELGAERLRAALEDNTSLRSLDLSHNSLGFRTINKLVCSCASRHVKINTDGNFVFEEILNAVSHGIAFLFAIVGSVLLISEASDAKYSDYHYWSCVVYSFSLLFLFLSSCLYHSFFMLPTTFYIFQILDHVGIYVLIAGTYTPFLVIALHHHAVARAMVVLEWAAAGVGIVMAVASDLNSPLTATLELLLFLIMGFAIVFIYPVASELQQPARVLVALGGAAYVGGIPFFKLGSVNPSYHIVWHLFVNLGALLHWCAVYFFVLDTDIGLNILAQELGLKVDVARLLLWSMVSKNQTAVGEIHAEIHQHQWK